MSGVYGNLLRAVTPENFAARFGTITTSTTSARSPARTCRRRGARSSATAFRSASPSGGAIVTGHSPTSCSPDTERAGVTIDWRIAPDGRGPRRALRHRDRRRALDAAVPRDHAGWPRVLLLPRTARRAGLLARRWCCAVAFAVLVGSSWSRRSDRARRSWPLLPFFLPAAVALPVRRLHDRGRSAGGSSRPLVPDRGPALAVRRAVLRRARRARTGTGPTRARAATTWPCAPRPGSRARTTTASSTT